VDIRNSEKLQYYTERLYGIRKEKGLSLEQAGDLMKNSVYFGTMMVECGDADGLVSGSDSPTADTVRPALQIIKTREKFFRVSGLFIMDFNNKTLIFADCAVNIDPTAEELAQIAIDSAGTAKRFGIEPKIAMLSFSTNGSAKHERAEKVRKATEIVRKSRPDLVIDGEIQVDAAVVPDVAERKWPGQQLQG